MQHSLDRSRLEGFTAWEYQTGWGDLGVESLELLDVTCLLCPDICTSALTGTSWRRLPAAEICGACFCPGLNVNSVEQCGPFFHFIILPGSVVLRIFVERFYALYPSKPFPSRCGFRQFVNVDRGLYPASWRWLQTAAITSSCLWMSGARAANSASPEF